MVSDISHGRSTWTSQSNSTKCPTHENNKSGTRTKDSREAVQSPASREVLFDNSYNLITSISDTINGRNIQNMINNLKRLQLLDFVTQVLTARAKTSTTHTCHFPTTKHPLRFNFLQKQGSQFSETCGCSYMVLL